MRRGVLAALVALAACRSGGQDGGGERAPATGPAVRIELAGEGAVAGLVSAAASRARGEGRRLIVYVGAAWCAPCVEFHRAALAGQLDRDLAGVDFLEFDYDRDEARLTAAGYTSQWLPLFAVPAADGSASDRHIEGARKGTDYARALAARMRPLLAR